MGKQKAGSYGILAILLFLTFGRTLADPNSPKIRSVNVEVGAQTVNLVVQADKPVNVRTMELDTPKHMLVFDVSPSVLWGKKETKPVGRFGVADIRVAQFSSDPDVTRVVADLDGPAKYKLTPSVDQKILTIAFEGSEVAAAAPAPVRPPAASAPTLAPIASPALKASSLSTLTFQSKLRRIFMGEAASRKKKVRRPSMASDQIASFSWKNADLVDVIRSLADRMGLNVIVDTSVKGSVTLDLKNVSAGQALGMILAINGVSSRQIGNILMVGPADKLEKLPATPISVGPQAIQVIPLENAKPSDLRDTIANEYPEVKVDADPRTNSLLVKGPIGAIRKVKELVADLDKPVIVPPAVAPQKEVIQLNYSDAKQVLTQLKPLVPADATIIADDRLNAIIVIGSMYAVDSVKSYVAAVDVPSPQVMLEMQVIDLDSSATSELGINWGGGTKTNFAESAAGEAGVNLPAPGGAVVAANSINLTNLGIHTFVRDNMGFQAGINWAINNTKSKVLGSPRVATINNKEATIQLGQQYPIVYFDPRAGLYQVQYINIGVILKVTPTISPDGNIQVKIDTQVSDVAGTIQNFPITNTRQAQANLRVKNGETIVLGGLLKETSSDSIDKIPLLGDIPILGEFFRHRKYSKAKTDLIISITPTLLASH